MLKNIFIAAIILCSFSASAQTDTINIDKDTTVLNIGKYHILLMKAKDSIQNLSEKDTNDVSFWSGFGVGVNGLNPISPRVQANYNNFTKPLIFDKLEIDNVHSLSYHINPVEKHLKIYKNYVRLVTGFGFTWNNYALAKNYTLNTDAAGELYVTPLDTVYKYDRNKLRTNYIEVPLMLAFCTSNHPNHFKGFRLALGIISGMRYRTTYIQEYKDVLDNNKEKERRTHDSFATSPFLFKATARLSFGGVMVYGNYAINSMFKKGMGPDVHPFEVGIAL